jgi:apolipoprotein N-acyltransferase
MSGTESTLPVWRRSTFAIAVVGSLLMWAALTWPALGWLGWIAPVPWLMLVEVRELPGRRPYRALYLAGLVFWLTTIHWLRLPHPALYLGWLALSAYLAIYLPVFVAIARVAVFRFNWPLWLAAPVVWTGLELARAHLLTGFLMASVAHTQARWITIIQISDVVGEYGVDFLVMLVAGCVAHVARIVFFSPKSKYRVEKSKARRSIVAMVPAIVALTVTLAYGYWRISDAESITMSNSGKLGPRIALIQGNSSAEWKSDPSGGQQIMKEYIKLSEQAVAQSRNYGDGRPVDLIVWPETMFRNPLREFDDGYQIPPGANVTPDEIAAFDRQQLRDLSTNLGTPVLVGIDRIHFIADANSASERPTIAAFNSAVLVGSDGKIIGTYDKMHRVMFGEYIPFADWIPFLYTVTPLTGGIVAGAAPAALTLDDKYCFSPNICYETAIPHVIRRQVKSLKNQSQYPTALINLTNDAWYWGSSELDMHLACDVFRAVETRVPLVIAANGGISASIDRTGRVLAKGGKQRAEILLADVEPGYMSSWYLEFGDWFAGLCLFASIFFAIVEVRARRALRRRSVPPPAD